MSKKNQTNPTPRNFNTISPSAKSLMFMKGYTSIPFARQTAELLKKPEKFIPDVENKDFTFWARTLHFENRYWSIDNLLSDPDIKNILELSSGFSYRGLEISKQKGFYYIDTDLPDIIEIKKDFIPALQSKPMLGKLEVLPLNALDETEFQKIVDHFPEGELVIVNEGLLMYLNLGEKKKLCRIIHNILSKRGGYWITADIYIKKQMEKLNLKMDKDTAAFLEQHKIEENKFSSFEEAEDFFNQQGFVIDKEANVDPAKLSALNYFRNSIPKENASMFQNSPKMQVTWRLRIK
jgi:O-methyltransferase involved in polyketide biosynthesis